MKNKQLQKEYEKKIAENGEILTEQQKEIMKLFHKREIKNAIILLHGYGGDGKDISMLSLNWKRHMLGEGGGLTVGTAARHLVGVWGVTVSPSACTLVSCH